MKYDLTFILRQRLNNAPKFKTVSDTRSIRHTSDGDPLTLFDFTGGVDAHAVVRSLMLPSHICDLKGCLQFVRGLGSEGSLVFRAVPGEDNGQGASLNGAHQRHILPLGDVPHVGQDSQHRLGHRFCKQTFVGQRPFFLVSKRFGAHHTYNVGVMQSFRHSRLFVPAVSGAANQFANVWNLVNGWHVKDGPLFRVHHHSGLSGAARAGHSVGDRQGAVVTVAEHLEGLPQHQRPPHHTQDRLWNSHCRRKESPVVYRPGKKRTMLTLA